MHARTRARGWTLQMLYAWETRGGTEPLDGVRREFLRERRVAEESQEYIQRLVEMIDAHRIEIDAAVQGSLTNWRLDRLARIDRNVLRIAAAEMLYFDDVPPRVSIQEAIRLVEKYGTEESPRFVNGVLDALMRRLGRVSDPH